MTNIQIEKIVETNMRKLNKKGMWAKNVAGWGGITSLAFGMIFIEHIGLATAITLEIIGCAGILFASFYN